MALGHNVFKPPACSSLSLIIQTTPVDQCNFFPCWFPAGSAIANSSRVVYHPARVATLMYVHTIQEHE